MRTRLFTPANVPFAPGRLALGLLATALVSPPALAAQTYWPGTHLDWERIDPADAGFDPVRLQAAVDFAIASESTSPRDLEFNHQMTFAREPHGEAIGPFTERAPQTGLIIHRGRIVAEWGEPEKVDNTFSVAKSFLSTTVGLAWDRGMIGSVDDLVRHYVPPIVLEAGDGEPDDLDGRRPKLLFESEHNRKITWDHLLRQTSDWEGTLWGKPEWADRPDQDRSTWKTRPRVGPGTVFEYNDTRVNLLALASASVWRRPLPDVLREYVMDPIGASPTWRWHGYDNSWIILDGAMVQSVAGGSHWGGGMMINAYDLGRLGLLTLHKGMWNGRRILSEEWIDMATTPGAANDGYGYMNYYLNTDRDRYPNAPEYTWTHSGAGSNLVYVDPANELVVVARWIQGRAMNDFLGMIFEAMGDMAEVASTPEAAVAQTQEVPDWLHFDIDDIRAQRAEHGRAWQEFIRVPDLFTGLYEIPVGGEDMQSPHDADEVYYVLAGRATARVEGDEIAVGPGSVLYVAKDREHRFVDITEDLSILVFFATAGGG